jgi:hypothetical protein
MNMEEQLLPIVPFGKYKGKPITELLADTQKLNYYKDAGILQKYPIVYNICVNQTITTTNPNSKTPEHNKLQNLFLENENIEKIWSIIINKYCKSNRHIPLKLNSYKIEFEGRFNWDCIFVFDNYTQCLNGRRCCSEEFGKSALFVFSEIKPLLGDDYPCVLRKMKNQVELTKNAYKEKTGFGIFHTKYLLIIKEYNSINTSKDELIKIFTQTGINIVFTNEILDNLPSKMTTTPEEEISDNSIIQTTPQQETEEENKLLREKLLHAEEKIKQLEEEILSLKTQKQSKSIKDYFGKK